MVYSAMRIKKLRNIYTNSTPFLWLVLVTVVVVPLTGCTIGAVAPDAQQAVPTDAVQDGWVDASPTFYGICFESALDAAGQVFVLRSAEDLIRLYDLADNSGLCERAVGREMYAFSDDTVLIGTWSAGMGCTAHHDVTRFERDDVAQTLTIAAQFITEGDCPYELVRPFWLGLAGVADYDIRLIVE